MSSRIQSFRDLKVWQAGMDLVKQVYEATSSFPSHGQFGLTSQLRRAAVSIPSNIAEGHSRESTKEYLHHISFALGSLAETVTQLLLACELSYGRQDAIQRALNLAEMIGKMLRSLQRALRSKLRAAKSPAPLPPIP